MKKTPSKKAMEDLKVQILVGVNCLYCHKPLPTNRYMVCHDDQGVIHGAIHVECDPAYDPPVVAFGNRADALRYLGPELAKNGCVVYRGHHIHQGEAGPYVITDGGKSPVADLAAALTLIEKLPPIGREEG